MIYWELNFNIIMLVIENVKYSPLAFGNSLEFPLRKSFRQRAIFDCNPMCHPNNILEPLQLLFIRHNRTYLIFLLLYSVLTHCMSCDLWLWSGCQETTDFSTSPHTHILCLFQANGPRYISSLTWFGRQRMTFFSSSYSIKHVILQLFKL